MANEIFIYIKFVAGGGYQYLTTGDTESVDFDGTVRQFVTGAILENFEIVSSIGEFEANEITLKIVETNNAAFWQIQTELANIHHIDVMFMKKKSDGTLSDANTICRGFVKDKGVENGIFYLKIQDRVQNMSVPFSNVILENEYPNAGLNAGKYIATGVGVIDTSKIPVSANYPGGVITAYLINTVGNDKTYIAFDTPTTDGSETVTKVLNGEVNVPNFTMTKETRTINGQSIARVFVNASGSSLPTELKCWPTYGWKGLTPVTALKKMLKMVSSELDLDETSAANQEFLAVIQRRRLHSGSDLSIAFSQQGDQSAAEVLKVFQDSFSCMVRVNAIGKIELIAIEPGNITAIHKIFPSDIVSFNYSRTIEEDIENDIEGFWGYQNIQGKALFYESDNTPDKAWSISKFKTHHIHVDYRLAYTENHACTMQKIWLAMKHIPYIETSISLVDSSFPYTLLPGDIIGMSDVKDISAGTVNGKYCILRIRRNVNSGTCDLIIWDVTKHALMDYTCQLSVQSEASGILNFCDHSLGSLGNLPITNVSIKQETDVTALNLVSWKYSAADANLYVPQASFLKIGSMPDNSEISFSFLFRPLSIASNQRIFSVGREDVQRDFYALRMLATTGYLNIAKQTNAIQDFSISANTGALQVGTWGHIVVYLKKNGSNTEISIYNNGVRVISSTQNSGSSYNAGLTVGALRVFGLATTEYTTGSFQEFALHHGNPWSAGGNNCNTQTLQNTFFGVNGKRMYDNVYPPD
jgi:hypothetical protein